MAYFQESLSMLLFLKQEVLESAKGKDKIILKTFYQIIVVSVNYLNSVLKVSLIFIY